jgi:hypothetical protein
MKYRHKLIFYNNLSHIVIPAKAGIHYFDILLDIPKGYDRPLIYSILT